MHTYLSLSFHKTVVSFPKRGLFVSETLQLHNFLPLTLQRCPTLEWWSGRPQLESTPASWNRVGRQQRTPLSPSPSSLLPPATSSVWALSWAARVETRSPLPIPLGDQLEVYTCFYPSFNEKHVVYTKYTQLGRPSIIISMRIS